MIDNVSAMDIAVSGVRAQRTRMNVIANNIANAFSTRTAAGGPYRRQVTIFEAASTSGPLDPSSFGVKVKEIIDDLSPFQSVYDPSHPDANEDGIVLFPNVNLAIEMINLLSAQRAYEASIDVMLSSRRMTQRALEIIQT